MPLSEDELLKKYGMGGGGKEAAPETKPEREPASDLEEGFAEWGRGSERGMRKSLAKAVTGIPRLANAGIGLFSPSLRNTLGNLAEKVPGVKSLEEFAAEPSSGTAETVGGLGADLMTLLAGGGELKLGDLAARGTEKLATAGRLPGVFQAGAGFVRKPTPLLNEAKRAAQIGGDVVESSARGAVGGAIADPEDPGRGGLAGAAGGPLGPVIGRTFQSPVARFVSSVALPEAIWYSVHKMFPEVPFYPGGATIVWHGSPLGRRLRRVGSAVVDEGGRVIGRVMPQVSGYVAGGLGAAAAGPSSSPGLSTDQDSGAPSYQDLLTEPSR